jgi:TIR domain
MPKIFISYRRDDSGGWAGRLYDRLSQHFGRDNVFMDITAIEPGLDFVEVIQEAVASCDILIAVIGRQWLTVTDASGQRRLNNPEDFVRLEVGAALGRNIRVIPALVQNASMPRSTDLPESLQKLARRNALEISDTRFHQDTDRLIEVLTRVLGGSPASPRQSTPLVPETPTQPKEPQLPTLHPFEPEMILIPAG